MDIKSALKRFGQICLIPFKIAIGGFKSFFAIMQVKKELDVRRTTGIYAKGNKLLTRKLETTDDALLQDPFKQRLFSKKNTYLTEDGDDVVVLSADYPIALELDKLKKTYEVETSEIISVEDVLKLDGAVDEKKKKLTYKRTVYTPLDLHEKDSMVSQEVGILAGKVWNSKVFQFLDPTSKADLIVAFVSGILIGGLLLMTCAYWLK
jgi:hypothetical protein